MLVYTNQISKKFLEKKKIFPCIEKWKSDESLTIMCASMRKKYYEYQFILNPFKNYHSPYIIHTYISREYETLDRAKMRVRTFIQPVMKVVPSFYSYLRVRTFILPQSKGTYPHYGLNEGTYPWIGVKWRYVPSLWAKWRYV